jgi:hypothetical protein
VTEAMISDAARLLGGMPRGTDISDDDLRFALAGLVRVFGDRAADDARMLVFPEGHDVTANEAMVSVTAILRALNLQIFELGLWQNWTGRH